jgi:two-component system phosphate regulon sensor histidine kinase PhoR
MGFIKNRYLRTLFLHLLILASGLICLNSNWMQSAQVSALKTRLLDQAVSSSQELRTQFQVGGDQQTLLAWLETTEKETSNPMVIFLPDSKILSPSSQSSLLADENSGIEASVFTEKKPILNVTTSGNNRKVVACSPVLVKDQSIQAVFCIYQPLARTEQTAALILSQLSIGWSFLLGLSAAFNLFFLYKTIHPIQKLTRQLDSLPITMNYQPFQSSRRDGIEKLVFSLNKLLTHFNHQTSILTNETIKRNSILKHMSDGIIIVNEADIVEELNLEAQRIFEIEESDAIGLTLIEVARHHRLIELHHACKTSRKQESVTFETIPNKLFLNAVASPLQPPLKGHTLLVIQDLTRLRHLEMVRKDFVSNVSHELRTPIASIKALAETLSEGAIDDPQDARRFLGMMENEIDNITQMVQELLELSRIEAGKAILDRCGVHPQELILTSYERMLIQAERAGLKMEWDCSDQLPQVFADAAKVGQVFINLIHNAIKFSTAGGKITLKAIQSSSKIIFSVTDEGIGIDPHNLNRIFERFYKEDQARSGQGTGLGLAIAKHIIESHGGKIWAENNNPKGSSFLFTLPIL